VWIVAVDMRGSLDDRQRATRSIAGVAAIRA